MNESSSLQKFMSIVAELSTPRIALVGFMVAAFYYFTLYDDGSQITASIVNLKSLIEQENTKKIETTRILKKEEQMRADISLLIKKYEEVKSKVPIEFPESELRVMIDQLTQQYNLVTSKNNRAQPLVDLASHQDAKLIEQVPLFYTFNGTFQSMFNFIQQVLTKEKLIKIDNLSISSVDRTQGKMRKNEVVFSLNIVGFKQAQPSDDKNKGQRL